MDTLRRPKLSAVLMLLPLLLAGRAPSAEVPIGAKLRSVEEPEARTLAGFAVRGVAIEEVQPGGLIELMGLRVGDVVVQVNATRCERPEDITRGARALDDANLVIYWRGGRKWTIECSAPQAKKLAAVLPPIEIDDPDSAWKLVLKASGLVVDLMPELPPNLDQYAAVLLANEQVAKPAITADLKRFLAKGNGVALVGWTPNRLAGSDGEETELRNIADWFGSSGMGRTEGWSAGRLVLRANKPFGTQLTAGQNVYGYKGEQVWPCLFRPEWLGPRVVPLAAWAHVNPRVPDACGAFYHRYGDGRVFYTPLVHDVNYPLAAELAAAGLRWVARAVD